jgi:hypothetical protein
MVKELMLVALWDLGSVKGSEQELVEETVVIQALLWALQKEGQLEHYKPRNYKTRHNIQLVDM